MADAAVSALTFAAKFALRVMQLVNQRKANLAAADDLLKRLKSIHHFLGLLEGMKEQDLSDLEPILEGVNSVLESIEKYVSESIEAATGKSKLKKLLSVHGADNIKLKLEEQDVKLGKYLQLLTAAQSAKQLQQSRRIEDQIEKLTQLSNSMFAFSLIANAQAQQQPQPMMMQRAARARQAERGRRTKSEGPPSSAKATSRRRFEPEPEEEEDEDEEDDDDDEEEDDEDEEEGEDEEEVAGLRSPSAGANSFKRSVPSPVRSASLPAFGRDGGSSSNSLAQPLLIGGSSASLGGNPLSSPTSVGTGPRRLRRSTGTGVQMQSVTTTAATGALSSLLPPPAGSADSTPERRAIKKGKKAQGKKKGKSPVKAAKSKADDHEGVEGGKPSIRASSLSGGGDNPLPSPRSLSGLGHEEAAEIDELAAQVARDRRFGRYAEQASHQMITGYFLGAMALMTDDEWKRVLMTIVIPFSPIIIMLVCAWWAGQLKAAIGAGDNEESFLFFGKTFLKNTWIVWRMYASPSIFAVFVLALLGAVNAHTSLHLYSEFLIALAGGTLLYAFIFWLSEPTPPKIAASKQLNDLNDDEAEAAAAV